MRFMNEHHHYQPLPVNSVYKVESTSVERDDVDVQGVNPLRQPFDIEQKNTDGICPKDTSSKDENQEEVNHVMSQAEIAFREDAMSEDLRAEFERRTQNTSALRMVWLAPKWA
jgi:hypothetical protein